MELLDWSYGRNHQVKARFSSFPRSIVVFRSFSDYYFIYIYSACWSREDRGLPKSELEEMERMMNDELGCLEQYELRHEAQRME